MDTNELEKIRRRRQAQGLPVCNLSNGDFHSQGFIPPRDQLTPGLEHWLDHRHYEPDPRGHPAAREAVARYYHEGGPSTPPLPGSPGTAALEPRILMCASTSEAYALIFRTFGKAGQNVLIPRPSYPLFERILCDCGLEARPYPLDPRRAWAPDLAMIDLLADHRTLCLVIISPNNPCGSVLSPGEAHDLGLLARDRGFFLVHDEVFAEYVPPPRTHVRFPPLPGLEVFYLNGLSKGWASPDLKVAWILHQGPASQERLASLEEAYDTYLNCSWTTQHLVPWLLPRSAPLHGPIMEVLRANREALAERLPRWPARMSLPAGGMHGILELDREAWPDDEALAVAILQDEGLYIHPARWYHLGSSSGLVLCFLHPSESWARALQVLETFLLSEASP